VLDQWAYDNNVRLQSIDAGKPIQNAFIESFNSRLREGVTKPTGAPLARGPVFLVKDALPSQSWTVAFGAAPL
jgi:hypothetical protein